MDKINHVQVNTPSYAQDGKFHVRLTQGYFQNLRRMTSWPLIVLFFLVVWLEWEGTPLLLFSFEQRQILFFGIQLSWHDLPLLAGVMIAGASLLFFAAVAWGRVWCGFACPQSIWTWIFIRIEDWIEGSAQQRSRREKRVLTPKDIFRRVAKHLLWIGVASLTAITFTGYFIPIRDLISPEVFQSSTTLGWLVIMATLTYLNAGLVREKICLHACPYSRFQAVMFDQHTRTVTYDVERGEPRGKRRQAEALKQPIGDCVDCGICVQVCPTGIDIREGLQAACIDCAACVDACDTVMQTLDRPKGLIRFASEAQLQKRPSPMIRPRLLGYGCVMLIAMGAVLFGFAAKESLRVDIARDRGPLFMQLDEHTFCNLYNVKVERFHPDLRNVSIRLTEPNVFELFGPTQLDLTDQNAQWVAYRVCSDQISSPRAEVGFLVEGHGVSRQLNTSFFTRSLDFQNN